MEIPDTSGSIMDLDLDLFSQTLGSNEKFALAVIGLVKIGEDSTIHLKDTAQRILLIITHIVGPTLIVGVGSSRAHVPTEAVIQLTNTSGQPLLTAKGLNRNVCNTLKLFEGLK